MKNLFLSLAVLASMMATSGARADEDSALDQILKEHPELAEKPADSAPAAPVKKKKKVAGPKGYTRVIRCQVLDKQFNALAPYSIDLFQDNDMITKTQLAAVLSDNTEGVMLLEYRPKIKETDINKVTKVAKIVDIMRSHDELMVSDTEDGVSINISHLEYSVESPSPVRLTIKLSEETKDIQYMCTGWEI